MSTKAPRALTLTELERINYVTGNNASAVNGELAKLAVIATDAHAVSRRANQRCTACEYLGRYRLAGQAFTRWSCQLCAMEQPMHHNTGVPRLCTGCAGSYGLCASCGGDIETLTRGRRTGRKARMVES